MNNSHSQMTWPLRKLLTVMQQPRQMKTTTAAAVVAAVVTRKRARRTAAAQMRRSQVRVCLCSGSWRGCEVGSIDLTSKS